MRRTLAAALLLCAAPLAAQPLAQIKNATTYNGRFEAAGDGCTGGLAYDDGTFENGLRLNAADGRFVQRIDLTSPASLANVCLCWQSLSSGDSAVNFNLLVYDANGPSGQPGSLIASLPASATGIPSGLGGRFYRYDLTSAGINLQNNAFVGVQVNGLQEPGIYLCSDEGPLPARPAYASINSGATWANVLALAPLFEAFGIRAELGAPGGCVQSDTAMCLANNRFKVEATYRTSQGQQGQAHVVRLTPDTGYFWFFQSSNVEAVVKVLDACAINQRFWVFAGGLTDVEVRLTITDMETDAVKTYTNPINNAFLPVQDTGAFATCN